MSRPTDNGAWAVRALMDPTRREYVDRIAAASGWNAEAIREAIEDMARSFAVAYNSVHAQRNRALATRCHARWLTSQRRHRA